MQAVYILYIRTGIQLSLVRPSSSTPYPLLQRYSPTLWPHGYSLLCTPLRGVPKHVSLSWSLSLSFAHSPAAALILHHGRPLQTLRGGRGRYYMRKIQGVGVTQLPLNTGPGLRGKLSFVGRTTRRQKTGSEEMIVGQK